jgi:aryl-phospho-beta-D-glucosidase BglC (GH1 family)
MAKFFAFAACGAAADDFLARGAFQGDHVPPGVNFGGWLNLEDWFFSGEQGPMTVSTGSDVPQGQGACLPPLATQLAEHWPSEGRLAKMLNDTQGPEKTAEIFMAHRRSFIGNQDLADVRSLGIRKIRVPLNWAAFADALAPIDSNTYGMHDPDTDAAVVPDPFYSDTTALVTVPRQWLRTFLQRCAKHGLEVLLDMHAFPGGSSDGTYNGIWPAPPKFWLESSAIGDRNVKLTEAGQMIVNAMIEWVESLPREERRTVTGLTVMNEPAHISAGKDWADEEQVLDWLSTAADSFRKSQLPKEGVKLYMNMIETAFVDFGATVPAWYSKTFTHHERHSWAVMDVHWYSAWGGEFCSGRNTDGGAYFCDDPLEVIEQVYDTCLSGHVEDMKKFDGLLATSEFSLGTFDQARLACTDPATRALFLKEQVRSMARHGIEAFFWTWRMPFGPAFEAGWSLKHNLGAESPHRDYPCMEPLSPGGVLEL